MKTAEYAEGQKLQRTTKDTTGTKEYSDILAYSASSAVMIFENPDRIEE